MANVLVSNKKSLMSANLYNTLLPHCSTYIFPKRNTPVGRFALGYGLWFFVLFLKSYEKITFKEVNEGKQPQVLSFV